MKAVLAAVDMTDPAGGWGSARRRGIRTADPGGQWCNPMMSLQTPAV